MPDVFTQPDLPEESNKKEPSLFNSPEDATLPTAVHLFSTFAHRPSGISFAQQDHDEQIVLLIRRDFITNFPWITTSLLLASLPLFTSIILQAIGFRLGFLPLGFLTLVISFYYLIVIGYAFVNY